MLKESINTGFIPSYKKGFKLSKLKSGIDKTVIATIIKINKGKKIARNLPSNSMPPLTAHITITINERANMQAGVSGKETILANSVKSLTTRAPKLKAYNKKVSDNIFPNTFPKRKSSISYIFFPGKSLVILP